MKTEIAIDKIEKYLDENVPFFISVKPDRKAVIVHNVNQMLITGNRLSHIAQLDNQTISAYEIAELSKAKVLSGDNIYNIHLSPEFIESIKRYAVKYKEFGVDIDLSKQDLPHLPIN